MEYPVLRFSTQIHRAGRACSRTFHDVQVNHRGGNVAVPHQILDGADVDAAFKEMSGERMPKRVASRGFGEAGLAHSFLELALHGSFVDMVSCNPFASRMRAERGGWKYKLPGPFPAGIGIFAKQSLRDVGFTATARQIAGMFLVFPGQMFFQP